MAGKESRHVSTILHKSNSVQDNYTFAFASYQDNSLAILDRFNADRLAVDQAVVTE